MGQLCTKANDVGNGGDPDTTTADKIQQGDGKPSKKNDDDEDGGDSSYDDSGERQDSDDSNDDDDDDDDDAENSWNHQIIEDGYKNNGTGKNIKGLGLTSGKSHKKYSPGDVFTATVAKTNRNQDPGLKIEQINGKFYATEVSGLFATTPAIPGDKILTINAKDYRGFKHAKAMKKELRQAEGISILFLRRDPDASQSSASSYDSNSDEDDDKPNKDNGDESTELY